MAFMFPFFVFCLWCFLTLNLLRVTDSLTNLSSSRSLCLDCFFFLQWCSLNCLWERQGLTVVLWLFSMCKWLKSEMKACLMCLFPRHENTFWFVKGFTCINNETKIKNKKDQHIYFGSLFPLVQFFWLGFCVLIKIKITTFLFRFVFHVIHTVIFRRLKIFPRASYASGKQGAAERRVSVILRLFFQYKHTPAIGCSWAECMVWSLF